MKSSKLNLYMIMILACLLCNHIEGYAQHNVYKIKDALFDYYKKVDAHIQTPQAISMADTLFRMAQHENDTKTQCMALYCKMCHYYVIGDLPTQIKLFHQFSPFIKRTPYLHYYFGMWGNIIVQYINKGNHQQATQELTAYRREAHRLKSNFAIIQSNIMQANIYYNAGYYRLALTYYRSAFDFAKSKGIDMDYVTIIQLARCCLYLCRWSECREYLNMALKNPININNMATRLYAIMLSNECTQMPIDSVQAELTYQQLMKWQSNYPIMNNNQFLLDNALYDYYKYYKKDTVTAKKYLKENVHIPPHIDFIHQAEHYESIGDYKQASYYYGEYIKQVETMNFREEQYLIDEFVPQLDFYNLEYEKIQLRKRNNALQLETLNKSQKILTLTEQQTSGRLLIKQKEQGLITSQWTTQSASIEQQNRLLKNKKLQNEQDKKETLLTQEKARWQTTLGLILIAAIVFIVGFYSIEKWHKRKQLKKEKEMADKSNYMKSLFFQNMNHEIRTPLYAIGGFNKILNGEMSSQLSPEEKKQLISMITLNNQLLTTLVNDVIDLSDFESGTYKIHLTDVNINEVCNTVVESIRGKEDKGVNLSFQPNHAGDYFLHTDAQRLQQILSNYLTNACKHTDSGSIILAYEVVETVVRFSVTDTGCGVREEDTDKVFQRFMMADNNRRGVGLGLHICTLIANLLHGKVYIDKAYKKGARFVFDHPIVMTLIMLFMLWASPVCMEANNNNKMGINEQVYKLYQLAKDEYNPEKGMQIANRMFALADQKKDVRGKCYALYAQICFYVAAEDQDKYLQKLKEYKQLCYASGNYDVLINGWVEVITRLAAEKERKMAKKELGEFFEIAKKHCPTVGLGAYYYTAGNFYFAQQQYAAAVFYYLQALEHPNVDYCIVNGMAGQSFFVIGNYDKAIKYCEKSLTYSQSDHELLIPLVILEKSYCKRNRRADAKKIYDRLIKINLEGYVAEFTQFYHLALYTYYTFINDRKKADDAQKMAFNNIEGHQYEQGQYFYDRDQYEKAWKHFKKGANESTKWLTSNHADLNNFYTGRFDFKEAAQEKERLQLSAMGLELKQKKNSHQLLMLKHEQTISQLHQNELISKEKKNKLKLQRILLEQKKAEYQKQRIIEQGLVHQKIMAKSNYQWKMMTVAATVIFVMMVVIVFIRRLRRIERKMTVDAERAKLAEQKKSRFYESINQQIREPLDTIIRLNQQMNGEGDEKNLSQDTTPLSTEERKMNIDMLNNKTAFITSYINDILIISKLESDTYVANLSPCDIDLLCTQAISDIQTSHDEKSIIYQSEMHQAEIEAAVDAADAMATKKATTPATILSDAKMMGEAITSMLKYAVNNQDDISTIVLTSAIDHDKLILTTVYHSKMIPNEENIGLLKSRLIARLLHGKMEADTTQQPITKLIFRIKIS